MKRREFITLLGGAAAAWPLTARAQQPATQHRIAIFHPAIPTTLITETGGGTAWRAFFAELRRLGYVEGENLIIERYSAEGDHERYAGMAKEIVARNPDLIVTGTNPVVIAFRAATSTMPIVAFMLDPLKAVLVTSEGDLYANRQLIAELAQKHRLPAMCPYRDYVDAGGLMAYTVDLAELLRRMANDVHQILNGAKPGDIPIYQPTKFELLINLKTAKALGLTLSHALLAQAAEIIE